MLTVMNGPLRRGTVVMQGSATNSLPVPDSPVTSTVQSAWAVIAGLLEDFENGPRRADHLLEPQPLVEPLLQLADRFVLAMELDAAGDLRINSSSGLTGFVR